MKRTLTIALLAAGVLVSSTMINAESAMAAAPGNLSYHKNSADPRQGVLSFSTGSTLVADWRAGSGARTDWSNDCKRNYGWLPNGEYKTTWHTNYSGSVIHGRVIYLGDKRCSTGQVTRTELFIHSEQTVNNQQGNTEGTRWDGDNDYYSNGCIKMTPGDIAALFSRWAEAGSPQTVLLVTGP